MSNLGRLPEIIIAVLVAAALVILAITNHILGLIATTAAVVVLLLTFRSKWVDDGLDVEVVENGEEVMLVARARYGLGLDIHTTDYGFLIRNARGDSRRVLLGFRPMIVGRKFQNGVMVLLCRKPEYT